MQDFHFRIRYVGGPDATKKVLPEWQNIAVADLVLSHGAFITAKPCSGTGGLRDAIIEKALFHERNVASGAFTPAMELPFLAGDKLSGVELDDAALKDYASQHFVRVRTMVKALVDRWALATNAPYSAFACDIIPQGMPDADAYRATVDATGTVSIQRINTLDADKLN
ncbi:MAG: hypothetical protein GC134_09420 [Proteobacteria bacterium]|nr:hypothetical protein [Pseudomonadota bacterium]